MKKIFFLFLIMSVVLGINAQILNPVEWAYKVKKLPSGEFELHILAIIEKPWHLYGQYFEDGGPIKLKLVFTENENYKLIDNAKEFPKPTIERDEIFNIDVHYFTKKALFTQKVKINKPTEIILMIDGQVCNDNTGMCVMVFDEHYFMLK